MRKTLCYFIVGLSIAVTACSEKLPLGDCEFQGTFYDCEALDVCNEDDVQYRLACCNCQPETFCGGGNDCPIDPPPPPPPSASSCMTCHNGAEQQEDYSGPGTNNPHPYTGAYYLSCIACHGGDPDGLGREQSHVPRPPEIGDDLQLANDPEAYFNFLTHAGIDKYDDYEANGNTYSSIDYIQFINPGDMRVVSEGRGCGQQGCHGSEHGAWVPNSIIATQAGFYSATLFTSGLPNANPSYAGEWFDTASEYGFRAATNPNFEEAHWDNAAYLGSVPSLQEFPENAVYNDPAGVFNNPLYDANQLNNYVRPAGDQFANQILPGTPLETLVQEIIGITCGDCHLGSRGANNRYGDFRSSGCTGCHMEYSPDGRSRSLDPNVRKDEPANPDAIAAPEDSHPQTHSIRNVARILPGGAFQRGISDYACAGCHQGSNRTVLQFWGIRLDQNQDLVNNVQYPANPATFINTADNQMLFDPGVGNQTFNGRNANQYIQFEDYDGDNRDDTPADIHHESGMGCIDCHGSRDLHNGTKDDPTSGRIQSREDQTVKIECESCHGSGEQKPATVPCITYTGENAECPTDRNGNPLRNVTVDVNGDFFLLSRVNNTRHFVPLTYDVIRPNQKRNPLTNQLIYSPTASYVKGKADGDNETGIGPLQQEPLLNNPNFTHLDVATCSTCHASWANNCIGCHLRPGYDANPQNYFFSNTTGERITLFQQNADFVYISPIPFNIGIGSRDLVTSTAPGMKMFFAYDQDLNGQTSDTFAFTDRVGNGNNPGINGRGAFGSLAHNRIAPHATRASTDANNEGPRYCGSCHLNTQMLDDFGAEYAAFYDDYINRNYANFDFNLLQQHIGENPNNALNSPFFVHMVVGLGSGLFLFDANGCPVNPLDNDANRFFCDGTAPAAQFDLNTVVYDLDRHVEQTGVSNASNAHPMLSGAPSANRIGANNPGLAGPLGRQMLEKLADPNLGLILDSWIDSDGNAQGGAANFIQ